MIQLGDLRVFLEVAACGSFSAAARRLKMPKSSVGRQIDRLEATLGAVLLSRAPRAVALTADGRDFLPRARRLFDDGKEAETALQSRHRRATGLLSIGATAPFAKAFLVPGLAAFQDRHPDVELALHLSAARSELGTGEGQVDVAIRLRSVAGPDLGNRKLGEIGFAIVAAPGYLDQRGVPLRPEDLAAHRMIELGPPNKAPEANLYCGKDLATVRYRPHLRMDEPEAAVIAAENGCGIAIVPAFAVKSAIAAGRLVRILPDWAPAPVPIHVLYRADSAPPIRVRAYVDYLFETIGESRPWEA